MERFGIPMGKDTWADGMNPRGYFEDRRWHRIHLAVTGQKYDVKMPKGLAERHRKAYEQLVVGLHRQPIWGFKSPRTCMVFPHIMDIFQDPRVVIMMRNREDTAQSLVRHSHAAYKGRLRMELEQAQAVLDRWQEAMDWSLVHWDGPTHEVWYEELLSDPEPVVRELAEFCFEGLDFSPSEDRIERACRWVDPNLRHFGKPTPKEEALPDDEAEGEEEEEDE